MGEIMSFERLKQGFFRYQDNIYFAFRHGNWVFHLPVIDGKISSEEDGSNIYSEEKIETITYSEMAAHGLIIGPGDNITDPKFWI